MGATSDKGIIRDQAKKILDSGVLGRSRFYVALLEYLVACGEREHAPKEIEIAAEVFNRGDEFDPSQDSMVRVYAHNLRQKLQQFYAEQGRDEQNQITIPKGEYRIAVLATQVSETPIPAVAPPTDVRSEARAGAMRGRMPLALAAVLVVGLVAGIFLDRLWSADHDPAAEAYRELAASPLWSALADDELPVTMVVGDYYIFGERDRYGNVTRMVREFEINSSRDLDERFMLDPDSADRYIDLELTYLPTSTAFALRDLFGVLLAADKQIRVVPSSKFDTAAIRSSHVVYVGYLSGLGMLSDFVFAGSELAIGETYDELVRNGTGERFVSEAGMPTDLGSYRDYGLFSTLPGPAGNQLVFVAGMRDEGLMQTAEAASSLSMLSANVDAITAEDGSVPPAFELLYEVAGLDRTNLDAMIVHAAPLTQSRITLGQLAP